MRQSKNSMIAPLGSETPPKLGTPAYKTNEQVLQMNRRKAMMSWAGSKMQRQANTEQVIRRKAMRAGQ